MLKYIAIFTSLAAVCLAGDSSLYRDADPEFIRSGRRVEQRHKKLAAQPTPREWHSGAIWRFVTTAPSGKPPLPVITVRVTDEPAHSCSSDSDWKSDWRKLVVVEGKTPLPPIYQVEGRALQINLTGEICDVYDNIKGALTNAEFNGQRTATGLGAPSEVLGTVRGSCVQQ